MLHCLQTNVIGNLSPKADLVPWEPIVLYIYVRSNISGVLGCFVYLECSNNQITGQESIYILYIFSMKNVALWNRPQVDAVCPASRDPNQASCPRIPTCECFKDPYNKHHEDSFRLVSCLFSNFWGTQTWESFIGQRNKVRLLNPTKLELGRIWKQKQHLTSNL